MSHPPTRKQQRFLDFVQRYTLAHGEAPSYEEIQTGLGFTSPGTVNWYVQSLTKGDFLERARGPNGKRALQLTAEHATPARLPLMGVIAAGEPIEAVETPEALEVPATLKHPDNYILRVRGDSMRDDNIQDGDFVVIRRTPNAAAGQTVVALINGAATLKRYYPRSGRVELHPRNPDYPVIHVRETDDFQINGIVLYAFRTY